MQPGETGLVDGAPPGIAFFIAQRDHQPARNPDEHLSGAIPETVHSRIVVDGLRRTQPDVAVFILQLNEITVTVTRNARLGLLFLEAKVAAGFSSAFLFVGYHLISGDSTSVRQVPAHCHPA